MSELAVAAWLESEYLPRVARRVAFTYHLPAEDLPDLLQDLCLALWKAGPQRVVNATWIFHTANHRAIEILKRGRRFVQLPTTGAERLAETPSADPEKVLLVNARASRLPESLHRFYRLRFEEGYTQRELAKSEKLTRGLVRGMERECLERLGGRRRSSAKVS